MSAAFDSPVAEEVWQTVQALNACWLEGRPQALDPFFHEQVVMAMPGLVERVRGREAIVGSYAEFLKQATVHAFEPTDARVDVHVDVAVVTYQWKTDYELASVRYEETDSEILVLQRTDGRWQVLWRTLVLQPPAE